MKVSEERKWLEHYPKQVPYHISIPDVPLFQILTDSAKKYPEKTVLAFSPTRTKMSYQELDEKSNCFTHGLQKLGVKKGDRVAVILPNCFQFVIAYFGILKAGAVIVPLNPRYTPRELQYFLQDSETKIIISLEQMYPMIAKIKKKTFLHQIITVQIDRGGLKGEFLSFRELMNNSSPAYTPVKIDPWKDLAALQYTAGTTGKPKGVMLSHQNMVSVAVQIQSFCWMMEETEEEQETFLIVVPPFHVAGLASCLDWGIYIGAKIVLMPRFNPLETLQAISSYKPSFFFGVPAIYKALLGTIQKTGKKWSMDSFKFAAVGTAFCPSYLLHALNKMIPNFTQGYGLTESTGVSFANPIEGLNKIGSVGIPFPGVEVKIVDADSGREVEANRMGEILIKGPNIAQGYWKSPKETEKTFENGWLHTKDIGILDEDGYLYIVDRIKDIINVRGEKVSSVEVAQVLESYPGVVEAAVIGRPDPYWNEKIVAFVVVSRPIDIESLQSYCEERLVDYKVPREIKMLPSLPRSSIGKILKSELRKSVV